MISTITIRLKTQTPEKVTAIRDRIAGQITADPDAQLIAAKCIADGHAYVDHHPV